MTVTVRVADVAEINPRLTVRPASEETVSFLGMAGVDAESGTTTAGDSRHFAQVSKGYTQFHDGDLLVAKITPCFENGKIAQARLAHRIGVGSTEFHVIRPRLDTLDSRYALHFLRAPHVRAAGERRMTGSAGQRRVPEAFLADLRIPLPPIQEQRRIADILDRANALRTKRREVLALLDDLTQSIFLDMFGDPAANDQEHQLRPLIEWIDPARPITYGILKPGDDCPEGVPYVRVLDMKDRGIDPSDLRRTSVEISHQYRRSLLKSGDLLISIRGHVGRLAEVPDGANGANITQDSARLAVSADSRMYVMECLRTDAMQYWMRQRTKGAAVQGINLGDLKLLPLPAPPINQQRLFADRAVAVIGTRGAAKRQRDLADETFVSLQHQTFAGLL